MLRFESPLPVLPALLTISVGVTLGLISATVLETGEAASVPSMETVAENYGRLEIQTVATTAEDGCPNPGLGNAISRHGECTQQFVAVRYVRDRRQLRACMAEEGSVRCSAWESCEQARGRPDSEVGAYCRSHNNCGPWRTLHTDQIGARLVQVRSRECWPGPEFELIHYGYESAVGMTLSSVDRRELRAIPWRGDGTTFGGFLRYEGENQGDALVSLTHPIVAPVCSVPSSVPLGPYQVAQWNEEEPNYGPEGVCEAEPPWSERQALHVALKVRYLKEFGDLAEYLWLVDVMSIRRR